MPKQRLESFSDGVFAIVITLLVLNVHLDRDQELTLQTLANLGPEMLAFHFRDRRRLLGLAPQHVAHDQSSGSPAIVAQSPAAACCRVHTVSRISAWSASVESACGSREHGLCARARGMAPGSWNHKLN